MSTRIIFKIPEERCMPPRFCPLSLVLAISSGQTGV